MKLRYSILWLDDYIDDFIEDGLVNKLNTHLETEGFEPYIIPTDNPDKFFANLDSNKWDLILTDCNLTEKSGVEIIREIRSKSIDTEILFYTAQPELPPLPEIDRLSFLLTTKIDGVSHQSKVYDKAKHLVDLTIQKFQHIVSMRGMIMHETSALDAQMFEIVQSYLNCSKEQSCDTCACKLQCDEISKDIFDELDKFYASKNKLITQRSFKKLQRDTVLYSAEYKRKVLSKIIEKHSLEDFTEGYKKDIILLRNKFAHAVLLTDAEGKQYFENKDEDIIFNDDLCRKMREDIRLYKKKFDQLQKQLLKNESK